MFITKHEMSRKTRFNKSVRASNRVRSLCTYLQVHNLQIGRKAPRTRRLVSTRKVTSRGVGAVRLPRECRPKRILSTSLTIKKAANHDCRYDADRIGGEPGRQGVADAPHLHRSEIDGKDVEGRFGRALECGH